MGREEVKAIMDATKEKYSVIVDELITWYYDFRWSSKGITKLA